MCGKIRAPCLGEIHDVAAGDWIFSSYSLRRRHGTAVLSEILFMDVFLYIIKYYCNHMLVFILYTGYFTAQFSPSSIFYLKRVGYRRPYFVSKRINLLPIVPIKLVDRFDFWKRIKILEFVIKLTRKQFLYLIFRICT